MRGCGATFSAGTGLAGILQLCAKALRVGCFSIDQISAILEQHAIATMATLFGTLQQYYCRSTAAIAICSDNAVILIDTMMRDGYAKSLLVKNSLVVHLENNQCNNNSSTQITQQHRRWCLNNVMRCGLPHSRHYCLTKGNQTLPY